MIGQSLSGVGKANINMFTDFGISAAAPAASPFPGHHLLWQEHQRRMEAALKMTGEKAANERGRAALDLSSDKKVD